MIEYPRDFITKVRSVYSSDPEIIELLFHNDEVSFKQLGRLLKEKACKNNINNIDVINAYRNDSIESLYKIACDNVIKEELYGDWMILYSKHLSKECAFVGTKLLKRNSSI